MDQDTRGSQGWVAITRLCGLESALKTNEKAKVKAEIGRQKRNRKPLAVSLACQVEAKSSQWR